MGGRGGPVVVVGACRPAGETEKMLYMLFGWGTKTGAGTNVGVNPFGSIGMTLASL